MSLSFSCRHANTLCNICTDPSINSFITQDRYTQFLDASNVTLTEEWRAWTLSGRNDVGGYVFRYADNFAFATIRGSGHMVSATPTSSCVLCPFISL